MPLRGELAAAGDADWQRIRQDLTTRCRGRCEWCARPFLVGVVEPTVHHRQPRGMGGTSDPLVHRLSRLALLCGGRMGGVQGCHGLVESRRAEALARGFLVRHGDGPGCDPATVPLVLASGRRVLLDDLSPFYLRPPDGEWTLPVIGS